MAASSVRVVTSTSAQLPATMAVPGVGSGSGAGSGSATEEAAASDAAVLLAVSETAGEEALRSRLRTTVYQVWVAQSST